MVIISIIVLLAGIILPALNQFLIQSNKAKTQSAINMIDGGCRHYFNDFGDYPPSHDDAHSAWYGGQLLVLFLTGYKPDTDSDGIPGADIFSDDGVDGFGLRLVKRGDVYGPYGGCEKIETKSKVMNASGELVNTDPFFVDTFGTYGNCILYYRFDGSTYDFSDNRGDPDKKGADGPDDINYYARDSGTYHRTDFILISRGHNEEWNAPRDGGSDDVTNFFNR